MPGKHPPFLWNKPSHLICNLSVFYYFYAINKTVTTMIYRFTIISDEVDDFVREIQIDPEATFFDFHEAILKAAGYTNDQMTSFFICDDDWEKEKEITLEEMDNNPEMDSWIMKETRLNELIEDEKEIKGAKCTKKSGEAPKQTVDFEEMAAAGGSLDLDENFYGDQDFDMEDFDAEGFDVNDGASGGGGSYDEDKF